MIVQSDFDEWKNSPVTKALMALAHAAMDEIKNDFVGGGFLVLDSHEESSLRMAGAMGQAQQLQKLIDLTLQDLQP